ncbi:MAG: glycosyltransferase [Saprospiraceae bacterium]|nr:glycosyltransferase [Saprospiraceae bacterium]
MRSILILTDWYSPAYFAGGPIQSTQNLVGNISKYFQVWIYTSAFDLGEKRMMQNIQANTWVSKSPTLMIYYQSLKSPGASVYNKIIQTTIPDIVYLNSMFSKHFVLDYLRIRYSKDKYRKVILAPRGMLKQSALNKKWFKKGVFLHLARLFGLYHGIQFHATNQTEKNEILRFFPRANVLVLDNLPPAILVRPPNLNKLSHRLKLCFVGRIHPIKNLQFLLEVLQVVKSNITLSIVGQAEDKIYDMVCHQLVNALPQNISVNFLGGLPHDQINAILGDHHLFILPTLGENYGHAIIEALSVGRPVLISDQTPWKNLKDYNAGWEFPLSDKQAWINAIEEAASWDQGGFDRHCLGSLEYSRAHTNVEELVEKYREMFGG